MRIDADAGIGELGHVGPPDEDRAGALQASHDGGVGRCGLGGLPDDGAGPRGLAGDIEQVLDRDRHAGERPEIDAGGAHRVGVARLKPDGLAIMGEKDQAALALRRFGPVAGVVDQRGGGRFARNDGGLPMGDGVERQGRGRHGRLQRRRSGLRLSLPEAARQGEGRTERHAARAAACRLRHKTSGNVMT